MTTIFDNFGTLTKDAIKEGLENAPIRPLNDAADGFEFFMDETGFETYGSKGPRAKATRNPYVVVTRDKNGRAALNLSLDSDATAKAIDMWGGECEIIFNPVTLDLGLVSGASRKVCIRGRKPSAAPRALIAISKLRETFFKARGEHRYYVYEGRWLTRNDGEPVYAMRLIETAEQL